ncbi:MAG: hypothetical protein JNL70_27485 [Saprospiraceae bacterium]|nr:hypothetical protein [Saprospiraceae bacterium]
MNANGNNNRPLYIIMGINLLLILLAALGGYDTNLNEAKLVSGLIALCLFALNILGGIILFIAKRPDIGKAFMLSAAICLLIGLAVCSTANLNFH